MPYSVRPFRSNPVARNSPLTSNVHNSSPAASVQAITVFGQSKIIAARASETQRFHPFFARNYH